MNILIKEVNIFESSKDRNQFINLPWSIYKDNPYWVPPLKHTLDNMFSKSWPYFKKVKLMAWMAYLDDKPCGRIVAIYDPKISNKGFFGFFESIDNLEVATQLFDKATGYLSQFKINYIEGPVNPSMNHEAGLLIEGFEDSPQIMMTYNPKYYQNLFEEIGLTKAKDLLAYKTSFPKDLPGRVTKIAKRSLSNPKISFRKVSLKNWDNEVETIFHIYNKAWEKNWGFTPMDKDEFFAMANDLKNIVNPNLILFALVDKKEVGFIIGQADYNQILKKIPSGKLLPFGIFKLIFLKNYIDRLRIITLGVLPEFRNMGLDALLYVQIHKILKSYPRFKSVEMSWVLEDNFKMIAPLKAMGAFPYKKYRIFKWIVS